jgi:hypothetical protein
MGILSSSWLEVFRLLFSIWGFLIHGVHLKSVIAVSLIVLIIEAITYFWVKKFQTLQDYKRKISGLFWGHGFLCATMVILVLLDVSFQNAGRIYGKELFRVCVAVFAIEMAVNFFANVFVWLQTKANG